MLNKSIALSLLLTTTLGASATTLEQVFAEVTPQSPACFTKGYDAAHLRQHPRQTVRQIKIKLYQWVFDKAQPAQPMLAIQVKRKGEDKTWTNNISCMTDQGKVLCAVECDGGSVEVLERQTGGGPLTLKNNGVLLYGGCGDNTGDDGKEPESIFLESKKGGDDVFLLPQVDEGECADVTDEAH